MRFNFFPLLHDAMVSNHKLMVLNGDLGYIGFNSIEKDFPARYVNCGAAEQAMLDMAVGIAQAGLTPVCYSITPFLLYRPFETLRTYVNHEKVPIKLVGSGRDKDYAHDGVSHWADDSKTILNTLPNITQWYPETTEEMEKGLADFITNDTPGFLSLKR